MNKRIAFALVLIAAFVLSACSAATPMPSYGVSPERDESYAYEEEAPMAEPSAGAGDGFNDYSAPQERMVITNAQVELAVAEPVDAMADIRAMANEMNGYTVNAYQYLVTLSSGAEVTQAEITIRVPAERFDEVMTRIKALSDKEALSETINSQDVTAEYTDLESRLRNLEAAEEQLQTIMDAATETEDVLSVYNNLVSVREQIEVIKGQMQYYEQSAAMSSIYVSLKANESVQPITVGGWEPQGIAKDAVQALVNVLKFLASAAIWIVIVVLPVSILLLAPFAVAFFIVRAVIRRNKNRRTPAAA